MELFTVDTAGDKDLLNASHGDSVETEYFAKEFRVESMDDVSRSDDDEDENEYDYGGECARSLEVTLPLKLNEFYFHSVSRFATTISGCDRDSEEAVVVPQTVIRQGDGKGEAIQ